MMKFIKFLALPVILAAAVACADKKPANGVRTEALDNSAWEVSSWISAADAPVFTGRVVDGSRAADGASWFVSFVTNEAKVVSAKWMTAGLGVYSLYVNGVQIGEEFLKPGFTHYAKTKLSFTYDVTGAMQRKPGSVNIFSAQVTPGWWADKIVTPSGNDRMIGTKCAFRGVLELTYSDGSKVLYGTDTENWLAGIAGPVKHAAIFDGEEYDARVLPGYETADMLSTPEVNNEFLGMIYPSDGAEIYLRKDLMLSPVRTYVWKNVEGASDDEYGKVVVDREYKAGEQIVLHAGENLVVDFGQNCAGVPAFSFNAAEGTKMTCLPGELLNDGNGAKSRVMDGPEGSVHRLNLRIPETGMILEYTFAQSDKPVYYYPQCTFFGYRLITVTADADVTFDSITTIPVTSIAGNLETGTITTGNELVNKIISNSRWGQLSNYLSVPTDCPQRNERLGWTADTQVFTEAGAFFANTDAFFHKWLRDLRDSQSPQGGYPGVAPLAQYGGDMMRVGWADAGIIVPWTIWRQFGDKSIVDESWESMERFMAHIAETKYDHRALAAENGNYQWADWLSYEPLESCEGRAFGRDIFGRSAPLPEAIDYWSYLCASYWAIDAGMMRDMAKATGKDARRFEVMEKEAKDYLRERFLTDDGTFKLDVLNTMQTPALFALKLGLVEGNAKDAVIGRLKDNFAAHGGCLQTGFLGTSILMQTLTENGMADLAWDLLFQRKNPSWLYSIDNGATTIWERWNSYTLESGMGPKGMNSFNHYAYGCVCQWLWETAAGIASDSSEPGFKHIIMKPIPDKRLGSVDAVLHSPVGTIRSAWSYNGDTCNWTFTIPENSSASVTLPGEKETRTYDPGTYELSF